MLEKYPPTVRKKIALFITLIVAVILTLFFVFYYMHRPLDGDAQNSEKFKDFFDTLSNTSDSIFEEK